MTLPPSFLRVRIRRSGRLIRDLWLPLVLIWPLVAAMFVVVLPVVLIIAAVKGQLRCLWALVCSAVCLFCALRGLRVEVDEPDKGESVLISIT
jgi:hypothetical protein